MHSGNVLLRRCVMHGVRVMHMACMIHIDVIEYIVGSNIFIKRMSECVRVMVRCRPMNGKEKERGCTSVVEVDTKNSQINLTKLDAKEPPKSFGFDCVFAPQAAQSLIYEQSAFSLVDSVLDGYNGTIFAYGQTGCGKTHTMMGLPDNQDQKGIIPRTFNQIITITKNDTSKTHLIRCSFIQIYNQEIHDLLSKDIKARMDIKESPQKGIFVKDLTQIEVDSIAKMELHMENGFKNRAVRETNMNKQSSRSHSIFTIYIDSQQKDQKGNDKYKASKLNLVDLAGSQKIAKTGTTGDGMKEATKINLSLSALGNVISALVDGKAQHIPYRDSKLTRLLQDSLGGNTKTIMIAAVSPADYNYEETLNTLRYASRAKHIKNKPKINEDPKDALLRQYMEEIQRLKLMLQGKAPLKVEPQHTTGYTLPNNSMNPSIILENNKENNTLQEQLRTKESMLRNEQEEKRILNDKLQRLQMHFNQNGPDQKDKSELEKIKKMKEQLKKQKEKEEEYIKEKQKREQQFMHIERSYKNLNEEVDYMTQCFKEVKKRYTATLTQLNDVRKEHQEDKEDLLDTIRYQEKEIKKFTAIISILMNNDQLQQIVNNSDWNEEKKEWTVPAFTYREKTVNFPKLHGATREQIEQERDRKQITFKEPKTKELEKRASYQGFRVNNILKNAREGSDIVVVNTVKITGRTTQLTPIKNDVSEKARGELKFSDDKKKKTTQRLDPIEIKSYS